MTRSVDSPGCCQVLPSLSPPARIGDRDYVDGYKRGRRPK